MAINTLPADIATAFEGSHPEDAQLEAIQWDWGEAVKMFPLLAELSAADHDLKTAAGRKAYIRQELMLLDALEQVHAYLSDILPEFRDSAVFIIGSPEIAYTDHIDRAREALTKGRIPAKLLSKLRDLHYRVTLTAVIRRMALSGVKQGHKARQGARQKRQEAQAGRARVKKAWDAMRVARPSLSATRIDELVASQLGTISARSVKRARLQRADRDGRGRV